jgi:SAM-dependent methyltransferase
MTTNTKDWYASWFNTPFYHILYKDRDHAEAMSFMENLTSYLNIPEQAHILDLACGRGRHSIYLNSIGYNVTGLDLSEESIAFAKQFETDNLHFDVHDMSKPYHQQFNAVFNLFTSFGYFENEANNLNTIKAIKSNLKENGVGVIDFMNVNYVIQNLIDKDEKVVEGILFTQKRYEENGYILKDITFESNNQNHHYQERVKALNLNDFKAMFKMAGLTLLEVFGDYKLKPFHSVTSERLILTFM